MNESNDVKPVKVKENSNAMRRALIQKAWIESFGDELGKCPKSLTDAIIRRCKRD